MPGPRTQVFRVDAADPDPGAIAVAAAVLRDGGLVAFPTETVYGLGANALNRTAVMRIFEAKERPAGDPLIVHVADLESARRVASVSRTAEALAARFWPGPLTLVLPRQPDLPAEISAGLGTVGVRVPAHPVARALLRAAGVPVAAPSANRFSRPSPTRAAHVLADLDGGIDVLLDAGPTDIGVESTVLDLTTTPPLVRRPGGVPIEELQTLLPEVERDVRVGRAGDVHVAPGQLLRHYAPRARLTLYEGPVRPMLARLADDVRAAVASGRRVGVLAPEEDLSELASRLAAVATSGRIVTQPYGTRRDVARAARALFDALRILDATGVDEILATGPDVDGLGMAIHDRLLRAAEGRIRRP